MTSLLIQLNSITIFICPWKTEPFFVLSPVLLTGKAKSEVEFITHLNPDMTKKVLIFDDDHDILNICSIILKRKGFDVFTRANCNDLLETIYNIDPAVIIMDNKIPDIGGVEATRLIKKNSPKNIPVIFFSANTHIAQLSEEAGADLYLQKPFDITRFEQILEETASMNNQLNNETV